MGSGINNSAAIPSPVDDVQGDRRWMSIHERHCKDPERAECKVLFLGDSLLERMNCLQIWDEKLKPLKAYNCGIGGDQTQHLLWRMENGALSNTSAKICVVLIGTNNHNHDAKSVADGVIAVVEKAFSILGPNIKVVLLALLPRGISPENPLREKINTINSILRDWVNNVTSQKKYNNLVFIECGSNLLLPNGEISHEIMPDYLHLSPKGYDSMMSKVIPQLYPSEDLTEL
eukprot:Nk52_evm31s2192 gene=Nk52_evmTU31s2192